jgi:NitT/TauT family transport system substrate-binding protein
MRLVGSRLLLLLFSIVLGACGGSTAPAASPGQPVSIKVNWTAVTGANGGLWTAVAANYFKDENLTVELTHISSSSRSIEALIAGDVQFGYMDGRNLIESNVAGADIRAVAGITNRLVFSIMASQRIQSPQDLRGKKLGITRPGSSTHTAALQALRGWGLKPKDDVALVNLSEVPNILTALVAGQVDAGVVSPPTNTRAKQAGFRELINLAVEGPPYPSVVVGARASYIAANPDVVRRFVKAHARGTQRFKADKAFAVNAIKTYFGTVDQSVLDDTWEQFSRYLATPPYPRGIEQVIEEVAADNPKAKGAKPEQFINMTFVKALEDSGFFKRP